MKKGLHKAHNTRLHTGVSIALNMSDSGINVKHYKQFESCLITYISLNPVHACTEGKMRIISFHRVQFHEGDGYRAEWGKPFFERSIEWGKSDFITVGS